MPKSSRPTTLRAPIPADHSAASAAPVAENDVVLAYFRQRVIEPLIEFARTRASESPSRNRCWRCGPLRGSGTGGPKQAEIAPLNVVRSYSAAAESANV